jgi:hypothetical protein
MAYIRMKDYSVIIPILWLHINENWILLSVLGYSFHTRHPRLCFEIWWWNRMGKISRTGRVKNDEVLHRVNKDRKIIQTIKRRTVSWISHILRRNCLLKHATEEKTEGRIDVTERRGRRRKQLLVDLKEKWRNWNLIWETLRIFCRTRTGRGMKLSQCRLGNEDTSVRT